jgi:hypothetical protein
MAAANIAPPAAAAASATSRTIVSLDLCDPSPLPVSGSASAPAPATSPPFDGSMPLAGGGPTTGGCAAASVAIAAVVAVAAGVFVAVGTAVFVAVAVAGADVFVAVATSGTGVFVGVAVPGSGVFVDVLVGGTGLFVGVSVGVGVLVGVFVGVSVGVLVGVSVGVAVGVFVGVSVGGGAPARIATAWAHGAPLGTVHDIATVPVEAERLPPACTTNGLATTPAQQHGPPGVTAPGSFVPITSTTVSPLRTPPIDVDADVEDPTPAKLPVAEARIGVTWSTPVQDVAPQTAMSPSLPPANVTTMLFTRLGGLTNHQSSTEEFTVFVDLIAVTVVDVNGVPLSVTEATVLLVPPSA